MNTNGSNVSVSREMSMRFNCDHQKDTADYIIEKCMLYMYGTHTLYYPAIYNDLHNYACIYMYNNQKEWLKYACIYIHNIKYIEL